MRVAGPVVDPVPCSGCGKLIDPLRAGHVAIFDHHFHYFCSRTPCRTAFLKEPAAPHSGPAPRVEPSVESSRRAARAARDEIDGPIRPAFAQIHDDEPLPLPPATGDDRALIEPIPRTVLNEEPGRLDLGEPRDVGALLLVIAIVAGVLVVSLALAGDAPLVVGARVVLAFVGTGMLVGRGATTARDTADPHPAPLLVAPIAALAVAAWAALMPDRPLAGEAASLSGIIVTGAAVSAWMADVARRHVSGERAWIAAALAVPARRAPEGGAAEAGSELAYDIRPGEHVLVETGEVVPVDLRVIGQEVDVYPWVTATTTVRRRDGDVIVAGAEVASGRLRGVCTWAGHDRAFARVLLDPRRRADVLAPIARASRAVAERGALVAAVIGAVTSLILGRIPIEIAMAAVAIGAALSTSIIATLAAAHVTRGILLGLRRGITYRSADAWDRAGKVSAVVFCARGTLLLGEPELAEVESPNGKLEPNEILALAAAAERTETHPIATSILRAARARSIRLDGVRNSNRHDGLGVTAITSAGEDLCVGNRALLLQQRISIAAAEQRIAELEGLGRTVILVAVGARLAGVLGFQDGLRAGARAAVQHLLDAQIEPVLMSGDARETCEATGRALDIDHIRPEILPSDRGAEVRRIIDTGTSVAVLGHPGADDAALAAADVAVALGAAGSTPGEHDVALASDDVRDGALSLALARRTRAEARAGAALVLAPALVGSAVVALGLLPPAYAPLAALLGGVMAVVHVRAQGRLQNTEAAAAR